MLHRTRSVRRNASLYQNSFSGEIKSCTSVNIIHHSADRGWTQRRATRRSALMMRHLSIYFFHFLHFKSTVSDITTFPTRKSKCSAIAWWQKCTVIWYNAMNVKNGSTTPLKIVKIGSVYANKSSSLTYLCILLFSSLYLIKKLRGQISYDFWQGVPNILGFWAGGAKYPRIFGRGCLISYSLMGVPVFLKGC